MNQSNHKQLPRILYSIELQSLEGKMFEQDRSVMVLLFSIKFCSSKSYLIIWDVSHLHRIKKQQQQQNQININHNEIIEIAYSLSNR